MPYHKKMRFIDTFAGIGGFRLAAEGAAKSVGLAAKCVLSVELDKKARETYLDNHGDTPEVDMTKIRPEDFPDHDLLLGGFPCQPFSQAGKRLGEDDPRNMWPHAVRVLVESGAPLGFFENVPGLLSSGYFGTVLGDLAEAGFDAEWCVLGADDVGAPHRRKRLWILAYAHDDAAREYARSVVRASRVLRRDTEGDIPAGRGEVSGGGAELPDAAGPGRKPRRAAGPGEEASGWALGGTGRRGGPWRFDPADVGDPLLPRHDEPLRPERPGGERAPVAASGEAPGRDEWELEPYVGRVAHGVAKRVDRLRALGNGQVPQCMAAAFTYMAGAAGLTEGEGMVDEYRHVVDGRGT